MKTDFLNILLGHNTWATRILLDDSAKLTTEQFHQPFDIGPGTIYDTLCHLIGAMLRWADRIAGRPPRETIKREDCRRTADELRAMLTQADADLRKTVADIDAGGRWNEVMEFHVEGGPTYRFTRAAALVHVMMHGAHHRAQVVNMRRRLGLPPLEFELDPIEWECIQTGQIKSD